MELQDFPQEILCKMLPATRIIALRKTSRTMRTAVENADAVVKARHFAHHDHREFIDGEGLVDQLNGLNDWCKVTVLCLKGCRLYGEGGGRAIAETLRVNTTITELDLMQTDLCEGGVQAIAEALRVNTTLTKLNLYGNKLVQGGGLAIAEALRVNITLKSLDLGDNCHIDDMEDCGRSQRHYA